MVVVLCVCGGGGGGCNYNAGYALRHTREAAPKRYFSLPPRLIMGFLKVVVRSVDLVCRPAAVLLPGAPLGLLARQAE